jgi:hypothetical protein
VPLRAGDIVKLFDGTTSPQKQKWFLCVYAGDGWFFRLNSKPHWKPCMEIKASVDRCLDHDCFIELRGVIEYDLDEVDRALLQPANLIGRLSDATLQAVIREVQIVKTLTPEEKATITREISAVLSA